MIQTLGNELDKQSWPQKSKEKAIAYYFGSFGDNRLHLHSLISGQAGMGSALGSCAVAMCFCLLAEWYSPQVTGDTLEELIREVLINTGLASGTALFIYELTMRMKKSRLETKQRANGGTPEDKVVKYMERLADSHEKHGAVQQQLLSSILKETEIQRLLLTRSLEVQSDHGKALADLALGVGLLKGTKRGT